MLKLKQTEDITNFDIVKDNIIVMARSKSFIDRHEDIPYVMKGDIALTFDIAIQPDDEDSFIGGLVNNELLKIWGIDEKTLYGLAMENTERMNPARISYIEEFLSGVVPGLTLSETSLLVITNEKGVGGATTLFYDGSMDNVAAEFGGSYFILPSSIHEVLAVPDKGEDYKDLERIVCEINNMIISDAGGDDREILSYKIHRYDAESGIFELASSFARRKAS